MARPDPIEPEEIHERLQTQVRDVDFSLIPRHQRKNIAPNSKMSDLLPMLVDINSACKSLMQAMVGQRRVLFNKLIAQYGSELATLIELEGRVRGDKIVPGHYGRLTTDHVTILKRKFAGTLSDLMTQLFFSFEETANWDLSYVPVGKKKELVAPWVKSTLDLLISQRMIMEKWLRLMAWENERYGEPDEVEVAYKRRLVDATARPGRPRRKDDRVVEEFREVVGG